MEVSGGGSCVLPSPVKTARASPGCFGEDRPGNPVMDGRIAPSLSYVRGQVSFFVCPFLVIAQWRFPPEQTPFRKDWISCEPTVACVLSARPVHAATEILDQVEPMSRFIRIIEPQPLPR